MLDPKLLQQFATHVDKIRYPIVLKASLVDPGDGSSGDGASGPGDQQASDKMLALLNDLASVSDHLTVEVLEGEQRSERRPSFRIERVESDIGVTFAGSPLGHEFTSLILALLQVGGHPPKIDDAVAEAVAGLSGRYHFETFYSLSCQNCPDVVQALNAASVLNPNITHTAIEGGTFADEAEARKVMAVPSVFLNGELFETGRVGLEQILAKLDDGAADRAAEAINEMDPFEVLVVGAGPAGATAALYTARKGIRTGLLGDRFGGQLLDTMGIENYPSVHYTEGPKLALALEHQVRELDVTVMVPQRAVALEPAEQAGGLHRVELESGAVVEARSLIVAAGARWRHLNVAGESDYLNRGVAFCPHCDGPIYAGKRIAVVGGGNSGVEAAIDLAGIVEHVTLLEFQGELLADEVLQRKARSLSNVEVVVNAATTEVIGDGERVTGLRYTDRQAGIDHDLDVAGIFVQIGLVPNTEWLGDAVARNDRGELVVDDRGNTSVPGIVAAGDCTTEPYKQIVVAAGAGASAALSAFDHLIRTPVS